ncbi:Gfo/Idh/MocA family protein [Fictibacillus sp. NRS-1165]|uniref:Gfo/Idh/MocA family protein n=1 Tax=Fictibacillus sp. NRS-1165 TaxID=3144463 RepID=UPI003D1E37D6
MYTVALIGAGSIAEWHLKAIPKIKELKSIAIADAAYEKAKKHSAIYGLTAYHDYKNMIKFEKPDIVVICLPHYLHKEVAVWCAQQGCHLLLEKPMALNVQECDEIIKTAASHKVKLMVGHIQQYQAVNQKAKEIIQSSELGQLVMINDSRHLNYFAKERPSWFFEREKAGGGILMNIGVHSVNKIQWLTESMITGVKAAITCFGDRGNIEGSGLIFLEIDGGITATISQSGYKGAAKDETEFIFTNGMMKLVGGKEIHVSRGGPYREVLLEKTEDPFFLQFNDLLKCIQKDQEPGCSGRDGRNVVAVMEAIYQSCETQREVIMIKEGYCAT